MNRSTGFIYAMSLASLCVLASDGYAVDTFTDVTIDPPFGEVLEKNRLLMEVGGAIIIVNPDGGRLAVAVGQVAYDGNSPAQQRINKSRVARQKTLRELVARTSPVRIIHRERFEERSRIETVDGGEQRGEAIEEYLSVTVSEFEAVVKDLPVVGRWYSANCHILYGAIGVEFSASK